MATNRSGVFRGLSRLLLVCLGMLAAMVALEAAMRLAGWSIRAVQDRRNTNRLEEGHQFRILCLGESTTQGNVGIRRYPEILQEILNRQELGLSIVVINMGRSGAVTREIVDELELNLDAFQPHLVVSMLGVNDGGRTHAYGEIISPGRGRWYGDLRIYKLYRLVAFNLTRRPPEDTEVATSPFGLGDGIYQQTPAVDPSFVPVGAIPPEPTPIAHSDLVLLETVARLIDEGNRIQARRLLENRLATDRGFASLWVELAGLRAHEGDLEGAHSLLLEGLESVGRNSVLLQAELAQSFARTGESQRAIDILVTTRKKLLRPDDLVNHTHYAGRLADLYEQTGQLDKAERILREIAEQMHPGHARFFDELIAFHQRHGEDAKAAHYSEIRARVANEYFNPETRANHRYILETTRSRGIRLVASQYPGRPVEEVRMLLGDDPWPIYVDNSFFRGLVANNGYDTYYIDAFAIDFGHLTDLGNRLLADNIARAIVERHFERDYVNALADVAFGDLVVGGVTE